MNPRLSCCIPVVYRAPVNGSGRPVRRSRSARRHPRRHRRARASPCRRTTDAGSRRASSTSASAASTAPTSPLYTHELAEDGSDWGIRGLGLLRRDAAHGRRAGAAGPPVHPVERGAGEPPARGSSAASSTTGTGRDGPVDAAELARRSRRGDRVADDHRGRLRRWRRQRAASDADTFDVLAARASSDGANGRQRRSRSSAATTCPATATRHGGPRSPPRPAPERRARGLDRAALRVPELDGRPHHPGHHRRRSRVARSTRIGVDDRWPVVAEPFRQWVIEDEFADGRPRWEDVGVLFTDRRPRLGAVQAAHAQRGPLVHGLPVRAGRRHLRRRGDGAPRRAAVPPPTCSTTRRSRR